MIKKFYVVLIVLFACHQLKSQSYLDHILDSGVLITGGATNSINNFESISDNSGGVFVLYSTGQSHDTIFAQHISSTGQLLWGNAQNPKAVAVKTNPDSYGIYLYSAISDGAGSFFISYYEDNTDADFPSYIQHVDSNGNKLMGTTGVKIQGKLYPAAFANIVPDGGSGVIACWEERIYNYSTSTFDYSQAFVQKFSSIGVPQWPGGPVQVCNSAGMTRNPFMIADGNKGAVIAFNDSRNCNPVDSFYNLDLYAQKIDGNGNLKWGSTGMPVATQADNQYVTDLILQPNKQQYTLVYGTEVDFKSTVQSFHLQQLNSTGNRTWQPDGVLLDAEEGYFVTSKLESDGAGGAVFFWGKTDPDTYQDYSFIQRIDSATGNLLWTSGKIDLLNNPALNYYSGDMAKDKQDNYLYSVDAYNDTEGYLKFQKLNAAGNALWGTSGKDYWFFGDKVLTTADGNTIVLSLPIVSSDNPYDYQNIVAYKMDDDGNMLWRSSPFTTIGDGDWNDPAVWQAGFVPPSAANVSISSNITVTANASCNSIKILPDGSVTVASGVTFAVLH